MFVEVLDNKSLSWSLCLKSLLNLTSLAVRMLDLRSTGSRFESWQPRYRVQPVESDRGGGIDRGRLTVHHFVQHYMCYVFNYDVILIECCIVVM